MPVVEFTRLDDALAARRSLQAQIARLEGELAKITASTYPPIAVAAARHPRGGPRLLDLGALERARDDLAGRVSTAHRLRAEQTTLQAEARALLEDMLANPHDHKRAVVTNAQLGVPGCTTYRVVPRLLSTWWRVKVSSGCPLLSAA
jgi:cell division protein FtsB